MRVVLLHAFPLDHRMWDAQVEGLAAAGHEVLAVDLPGFGGAPLLVADPSLAAVAQHVADEHLHEPAVVAGISLGGYVLMQLLREHAGKVKGAMFLDTKASADAPAAVENRMRIATIAEEQPAELGRFLVTAMLPTLIAPASPDRDRVVTWLMASPPAAVAWYQRAMAQRPDSHEVLSGFEGPSMVLWGDRDELSPAADQRRLIDALLFVREEEIPESGHLSAVEQPQAVTHAMLRALQDWAR
jgi:pimeloyl-ACP methyl ester carboxylesterase